MGPGESIRTISATSSISGPASIKRKSAAAMSRTRLAAACWCPSHSTSEKMRSLSRSCFTGNRRSTRSTNAVLS